jgi:hypothetical protein
MANLLYRTSSSATTPGSTSVKAAPLTNLEVDGNFKSINDDLATKLTASNSATLTNKTIEGLKELQVAVSASNIDLSLGNYFTKTISGTTTFTVTNVPSSGTATSIVLELTNGGAYTVNWWTTIKWAGGSAPTLTTSGKDVLGFYTFDNGTTWNGFVLGKDVK